MQTPLWLQRSRALGHGAVRLLTHERRDDGLLVPPSPPVCPPGWRTGPPDFVGVGVQRAGTTRWFELIAAHPRVMPPLATKELHYFDRFHAGGFGPREAERYRDYFPREGERLAGEWTPIYMAAPWIPPLLAQAAPRTRVLVLLRDPLERYLSGLAHDRRIAAEHGADITNLTLLQAFMRGFYHSQLRLLFSCFDRSRVLVLQYERCVRDPLAQLRRTFEFLELEDPGLPGSLVEAHPHHQPRKPALDGPVREAFAAAYREEVARLLELVPELDPELWPNFSELTASVS